MRKKKWVLKAKTWTFVHALERVLHNSSSSSISLAVIPTEGEMLVGFSDKSKISMLRVCPKKQNPGIFEFGGWYESKSWFQPPLFIPDLFFS